MVTWWLGKQEFTSEKLALSKFRETDPEEASIPLLRTIFSPSWKRKDRIIGSWCRI